MKLTDTQKVAVCETGKNMLISAGAGTGKTRVLVERFLHFVTALQTPVTEILALTFTEKAANEMKSRLLERLSELGMESARRDLESAYISTIHGFAARVLREHPLEAGIDPDFRVMESEEAHFLKDQSMEEAMESCEKGNELFELLKIYGERNIEKGLSDLLNAAHSEGKKLPEFFEIYRVSAPTSIEPPPISSPATRGRIKVGEMEKAASHGEPRQGRGGGELSEIFNALGEPELAKDWQRFTKLESWDWQAVEDFREWYKSFSSRRGKKGEEPSWREIKTICHLFLAQKMQVFAQPWAEKFEKLATVFEEIYERKKKEKGLLDFNDLETQALKLFKKPSRIHEKLRNRYQKKFRQIMVDEFQDTNLLQLELIQLLAGENNLFFVGDFKQSIYGFRGAEPQLFMEKEKEYQDPARGVSIPLLQNFRSAPPVLDLINSFFEELWREDGLPFQPLFPEKKDDDRAGVELLCVNQQKGEDLGRARMREADGLATRILELLEEGFSYGDMAILFEAMTESGIYEQALKKKGIPYYAISGRGFYHQPEIRDMISFLSFLENPLADIPLAAALRSPLFQISDDTLFWLSHYAKTADKETPLYEGVKIFENIPEIASEEKEKIRFFLTLAQDLLGLKDRLKLTELLDEILTRTSYELTVLADPQGIRRYANLKKLIHVARQFESLEPMRIGGFLRTLRRLRTQEARESEAQIDTEQSGRVVRLLTIHRAKGLEFPVVFIADMGRRGQATESKRVIVQSGLGYALQVRNEKTFEQEKPANWQAIHDAISQREKEEEKRLLYVAMTRAEKKLILSGAYKEKEEKKESFYAMSSWMDWVMGQTPEVLAKISTREPTSWPEKKAAGLEKEDFRKIFNAAKDIKKSTPAIEKEADEIWFRVQEKKRTPSRAIDLPVSAFAAFKKDPLQWWRIYQMGYPDMSTHENKMEEFEPREEELSAADFGTRIHSVLERMDFQNPKKNLSSFLQDAFRDANENELSEAQAIVNQFIAGTIFKEIQKSKKIYKELPFVLNARHGRLDGVIDLLFQDAAEAWHIVDYKTAVGDDKKMAESGYDLQIGLYGLAVYKILGVLPATGSVYFLKNQALFRVPLGQAEMTSYAATLDEMQENMLVFYQEVLNP